ncbi:MAG: hypothetical protein K8R59_17990 [Thermoanaerobaculales bacterium]|nr:hypothetical protein [Thermoanaerobaculales bacterium]
MKPRILWASPLPPVRSGVSDYAVELLTPLSKRAEIRVACPPELGQSLELPSDLDVKVVSAETRPEAGEVSLAHLGNNPYHEWIMERCSWDRSVVVVHDLVLHHLLVEHTVGRGDLEALGSALEMAHGGAGRILTEGRSFGLSGRLDPFLFPARRAVLAGAQAYVTHSLWGKKLLQESFPGTPVLSLKLPAVDPFPIDREDLRRSLGVEDDEVLLMHLGFLTPEKGMDLVLAGLAAARSSGLNARLILVGEQQKGTSYDRAVEKLGLAGKVQATGWLDWESMIRIPAAADLGIVLRVPSAGETSAAVLRFFACGTPAAVIGHRQFLEWPEKAAPRVTPGPSAAADVGRILLQVTTDTQWEQRRSSARATFEEGHRPEQVADELVGFLANLDF